MRGGRCDMARLRGISSPWVGGSVYSGVRRLLRRQPPTPPPPTPNPPSLHAPSPFEHNHAHPLPLPPAAGPDAGGGAEQPSPPPSPHRSRRHMRVGARVVARVGGIESERQSASYGQTIVGSIREGGTEGGGCGVSERALGDSAATQQYQVKTDFSKQDTVSEIVRDGRSDSSHIKTR